MYVQHVQPKITTCIYIYIHMYVYFADDLPSTIRAPVPTGGFPNVPPRAVPLLGVMAVTVGLGPRFLWVEATDQNQGCSNLKRCFVHCYPKDPWDWHIHLQYI